MHWRRNGENGFSIHKSTTISNESVQRQIILFVYNRIPPVQASTGKRNTGNSFSLFIANKESWIQKINLQNLPSQSLTTSAYSLFNVRYRPWPAQDKQQDIVKALGIQQDPMGFVPGSYWRILIKCNASIDWTEILVHRPQWLNLMVFTLLNLWKIHGSRKVQ